MRSFADDNGLSGAIGDVSHGNAGVSEEYPVTIDTGFSDAEYSDVIR